MGAGASATAKRNNPDKYLVDAVAKEFIVTASLEDDNDIELLQKELAAKDHQLQALRLEIERSIQLAPISHADVQAQVLQEELAAKDEQLQALRLEMDRSIQLAPVLDADQKSHVQTDIEILAGTRERKLTIYCNGVYDMCHIGHQAFFQKAGAQGNLIVGVHGDEACKGYKRPPIMSADERARQVAGCKGVWKVLKNAPLETITADFMKEYDIDVVALGEEYLQKDVKDDKWYAYPRESGRMIGLARTDGISTSDLIKRCADSVSDNLLSEKELLQVDPIAPILDADLDADTQQHRDSIKRKENPIVYCNGVYDMCHIGHQALFNKASAHGKLIVGVHGDVACKGYKRPPIMSADERARQVAGCKGVWKVLKNAPLVSVTPEFMETYKIDLVVVGEEYLQKDVNDDKWYKYPRESGKFVSLPRTDGISTSDLIQRCALQWIDGLETS